MRHRLLAGALTAAALAGCTGAPAPTPPSSAAPSPSPSVATLTSWALDLEMGTVADFGQASFSVVDSGPVQDGQWPVKIRRCMVDAQLWSTSPRPAPNLGGMKEPPRTAWWANIDGGEMIGHPLEVTVKESPEANREAPPEPKPGECDEYWLAFATDRPADRVWRFSDSFIFAASWVTSD